MTNSHEYLKSWSKLVFMVDSRALVQATPILHSEYQKSVCFLLVKMIRVPHGNRIRQTLMLTHLKIVVLITPHHQNQRSPLNRRSQTRDRGDGQLATYPKLTVSLLAGYRNHPPF